MVGVGKIKWSFLIVTKIQKVGESRRVLTICWDFEYHIM